MVINQGGNVGIGTTVPGAKLDVHTYSKWYHKTGGACTSGSSPFDYYPPCDCDISSAVKDCSEGSWTDDNVDNKCYDHYVDSKGWFCVIDYMVLGGYKSSLSVKDGKVGATHYCDEDGDNCVDAEDLRDTVKVGLWNLDTTTWACTTLNLEDWCGDADGCTMRLLLQHETDGNDQVRIIDEEIYMEQTSLSSNNGAGLYGWTSQSGGDYSWITGTGNRYTMFSPWNWVWMYNYRHTYCPGQVDHGPAYTDPYTFTFMSHPLVKSTILIYD